ncbi:MAG: type IV secretory system conjugative DNA transfer family protein [Solirubrobacteraceae bacterium]
MSRRDGGGISDTAMLALIGILLGVGIILWLWGGLAGLLFGTAWPRMDIGGLFGVLVRLPGHLGRPALAWPPGARRQLPGPAGVYGALAFLAAALGAIAAVSGRLSGLPGGHRGARWASSAELRTLAGRRSGGVGRLALGRHRGRLLHAEQRHALVAFGPPQSGKSAALAIPALLEWDGPAVASSIKTDLLAATIAHRRELGNVYVFDPFSLAGPGVRSHTWSPMQEARSWDGALEVAWRLATAGELDQRGVEGGDFWAIAAEQRLAPLLYIASHSRARIETLVRWVYGQGARELGEALAELTGAARDERELEDAHAAYDAIRAFEAQADRTRSSIEATAQALLRAYRFSRVARSAGSCEITADRLLEERATLYLVGDAKASKLLRPLFLALLGEIVDHAYERATRAGGQLDLPLLLCLDEAGNVAPLPNLAEIASTAPSHNIQLVSIFHDLQQARSRYGKQAETVLNSHRARILLPGVADLETLRYFSDLVGDEEAHELTRTTGAGGVTRSSARRRRPLMAAEALRQLPPGHALLLYGRLAPVRLRLRLWFEDRGLRRLAAGRPAAPAGACVRASAAPSPTDSGDVPA